MTQITPHGPRAHATDNAVRRYAERFLGETVDEAVTCDRTAVRMLKERRVDTARIRAASPTSAASSCRPAGRAATASPFPEALRFPLVEGKVVTVLAQAGKVKPTAPTPAPPRVRCFLQADFT